MQENYSKIKSEYAHITVLLTEAVEGLAVKTDGIYIDGTFGRGGHSRLILAQLGEHGRLIGIDRDLLAIAEAQKINDPRFTIVHSEFSDLKNIAEQQNVLGKVDGILLDLGVSSPQLDDSDRGFSFMQDGPLDMRMDTSKGLTAADWLNKAEEQDIAWVLKTFGEERFAKRIANAIVQQRAIEPFVTTKQLVTIIEKAMPFKDKNKHPATRSFQAIRIFMNNELQELEQLLEDSLSILAPGGRLSIISFHSLEDRIVKRFMRKHSQGTDVPKGLPLREDQIDRNKNLKCIGKALKPEATETSINKRARSAILRVAERI